MDVEDELDRLYELPLDEFTAARNELAKRLRGDGDRDEAERVRGLAKPTVATWAVNQLARRRPKRLKALLDAAGGLRKAQERALGGDHGDALRRAAQDERRVVLELRREARDLLAEAGRPAADATLERVAKTLKAAAHDPETRELLEAGRLAEEMEATGFEALAGMAPPAGRRRAVPAARGDDAAERGRRAAEARKRAAELRKRASALEQEARRAEREAERAAGEAERARAAADEARAEADEADAALASS
jgi:hypothetical protein